MRQRVWWCEERREAHVMLSAYGGENWKDQCIPHIDLERRPDYLHPNKKQLEQIHSQCGEAWVVRE